MICNKAKPPITHRVNYIRGYLSYGANSFVAIGEIELISTTILPGERPVATLFAPNGRP
jgi:hypothetical protein